MSNDVYPSLAGETFPRVKIPRFYTNKHVSDSGRAWRARKAAYPTYLYKLTYSHLTPADFDQLVGLFKKHGGSFESFLLQDPNDSSVESQLFATGNGVATAFQLVRVAGGFVEPVREFTVAPRVYRNQDWQGSQQLVEGARSNVLIRSEELDNATWSKSDLTVLGNWGVAPDGTTTADKLMETSANSTHYLFQAGGSFVPGDIATFSIYAKAAERNLCIVRFLNFGAFNDVPGRILTVDLNTGQILSQVGPLLAAGVEDAGGGWWRIFMTNQAVATGSGTVGIGAANSSPGGGYLGDPAKGIYAWGAQLSKTAVAGSYLKTTSAAASVTDYTRAGGLITLGVPLPSGATMRWSGQFYWRVNFARDDLELSEFVRQLWELKTVELETYKP